MKSVLSIVLIVSVMTCPPAFSSQRGRSESPEHKLVLEKRARVSGDRIRLKDVVKPTEALPETIENTELGHTPWPGHARKITPQLIGLRLATAGFDTEIFEFGGAEVCLVRLDVHRVGAEDIVGEARSYLKTQLADEDGELVLEQLNRVDPVRVAKGSGEPALRANYEGTGRLLGRVTVKVAVVLDGERVANVPVQFRARLYRRVAVASKQVKAGQTLEPRQVKWTRRDVGSFSSPCLTSEGELKDRVTARPISPGQVITRNMLDVKDQPICVEPQQRVRLIVETDVLKVTVAGRCLVQGRKGEKVTAVNLRTGRKVSGTVTAKGNIHVDM